MRRPQKACPFCESARPLRRLQGRSHARPFHHGSRQDPPEPPERHVLAPPASALDRDQARSIPGDHSVHAGPPALAMTDPAPNQPADVSPPVTDASAPVRVGAVRARLGEALPRARGVRVPAAHAVRARGPADRADDAAASCRRSPRARSSAGGRAAGVLRDRVGGDCRRAHGAAAGYDRSVQQSGARVESLAGRRVRHRVPVVHRAAVLHPRDGRAGDDAVDSPQ